MTISIASSVAQAKGPIRQISTTERVVALTFDDGPNSGNTEKLLALFEAEGVKATFFMIGEHVRKNPEIGKQVLAAGHEVGNHSMTHANLPKLESVELVRAEIAENQVLIAEQLGVTPVVFRAPYGAHDDKVWAVLDELELPSFMTRLQSSDWMEESTVEQILEESTTGIEPGDILLFHDWQSKSLEAMPEIIARLKAQGFRFVTVSELLDVPRFAQSGE